MLTGDFSGPLWKIDWNGCKGDGLALVPWKAVAKSEKLGGLAQFALRMLQITHSDAVVERSFSQMGNIHTKSRNRLTPKRLADLLFVKYNSRLLL